MIDLNYSKLDGDREIIISEAQYCELLKEAKNDDSFEEWTLSRDTFIELLKFTYMQTGAQEFHEKAARQRYELAFDKDTK